MGQTQTASTDTHKQRSADYLAKQSSLISVVKSNELLTAAAKAQAEKLAKLAALTPVGHEIDASRIETQVSAARGAEYFVRLNVLFVCAVLGHLEELNIVFNAWHERPFWGDKTFSSLFVDSKCSWNQWDQGTACTWSQQWDEGTAFACAVNEGHVEVARFLLEKFRANPRLTCMVDGNKVTALYLCVRRLQPDVIDMILSACDIPARVTLLYGEIPPQPDSPLELAIRSNNLETIQLLVNEKWGGSELIEALDNQTPIAMYCCFKEARPEVLQYLCQVFHKGLGNAFVYATMYPQWSATNKELLDIIVKHPNFPEGINSKTGNERTPLFMAIMRNHRDLALKFLSLGANPNTPCKCQLHHYEGIFTPTILGVILDQSELVTEMAKQGGVLPSQDYELWRYYGSSEYDHIQGYLKLFPNRAVSSISVSKYSEIIGPTDILRASMPVMDFENLPPNRTPKTPHMVSASVEIDGTITAMAALYQAETAGVLAHLDIPSLGRIQQTSRFWYHAGRSNSCWKQALLNSSGAWPHTARMVFSDLLNKMGADDQTKYEWKHVCFVWMSRNFCTGCGQVYRRCEGTKCPKGRLELHSPAVEYSVLENYNNAYIRSWKAVAPSHEAIVAECIALTRDTPFF
ncbi:hypothetical protein Pelo_3800 [Pelomyxa schiedti]|nr:hypothetical protein Pelo_3800 [Pelomyxa schiedti]